ncbi:MAG: hypothetical protein ACI83O_000368 [Patescibacteria group bacterium]|jgi:hypothetical protein
MVKEDNPNNKRNQLLIKSYTGLNIKGITLEFMEPEEIFNSHGILNFKHAVKFKINTNWQPLYVDLERKEYFMRVSKGPSTIYWIIDLNGRNAIRLPFLFGLRKIEWHIAKEEVEKIAQKHRWDKKYCAKCHKLYKESKKLCKSCNIYFCKKHLSPKNHNCENWDRRNCKGCSNEFLIWEKAHKCKFCGQINCPNCKSREAHDCASILEARKGR